MKITSVEIHPAPAGPVVELSFRDPQATNPYNVKAIGGLDAEGLVPLYSGVTDVSKLYHLAMAKRNVVLQLGLNPNYSDTETYSQLRDALYKVIAASRTGLVQLQFKNGEVVVAAISGFVSKFETDLFDRDQEVQLTFSCNDAMLKSLSRVAVNVSLLDPASTVVEDNKSTAPHGFQLVLKFLGNISVFTISNEDLGTSFTIRPREPFIHNDRLYLSSEFDNRYIYSVRDSVITHLADVVDFRSIWPILFPETNEFELSTPTFVEWEAISHYETYWGV